MKNLWEILMNGANLGGLLQKKKKNFEFKL